MRRINKYCLADTRITLCWLLIHQSGVVQAGGKRILGAVTSDEVVLQGNEIAVGTIGAQPPFPSTRPAARQGKSVAHWNLDHHLRQLR